MKWLLLTGVALLAQAATAGVFEGTTPLTFQVSERSGGQLVSTAVAASDGFVRLTTDYQSLGWEIRFDVELALAGGPGQPLESTFQSTGTITSNGLHPLSPLDPAGTTEIGTIASTLESIYSVTERVGNSTTTHQGQPNIDNQQATMNRINVADYPESIWLALPARTSYSLGSIESGPDSLISATLRVSGVNNIVLSELLPGDFNNNHTVGPADYTVWRDAPGIAPRVTSYDIWKENYGQTIGVNRSSVPEPAGVSMLFACLLAASVALGRQPNLLPGM